MSINNTELGQIVADKDFTFRTAEFKAVGGSEKARNFAMGLIQELAPFAQPGMYAAAGGALSTALTGDASLGALTALATGGAKLLDGIAKGSGPKR